MKRSCTILSFTLLALVTFVLGTALAQEKEATKAPAKASAKTKKAEAASAAAQVGKKETAKWTETTTAAAGTPEQKAVLEGGKVMTVTGELVEVSCYLQLGKRGEKHIPCGSDCLKNGQPFGVLTPTNVLYLVMAEEHDPRRYAQADLREALVPLLAKQVTITGMHTMNKGYHAIYVQAFELPGGKREVSK